MFSIKPSDLSYNSIREYAETIGYHHSIYSEQGKADIDQLISKIGGTTEKIKGDSPHSNKIMTVNGPQDFLIYLGSMESDRRRRFAKARALGYYFLHYRYAGVEGEKIFNHIAFEDRRVHIQANVFAAALLMPEALFKEQLMLQGGDFWKLSAIFEVSPAAAETRMETITL